MQLACGGAVPTLPPGLTYDTRLDGKQMAWSSGMVSPAGVSFCVVCSSSTLKHTKMAAGTCRPLYSRASLNHHFFWLDSTPSCVCGTGRPHAPVSRHLILTGRSRLSDMPPGGLRKTWPDHGRVYPLSAAVKMRPAWIHALASSHEAGSRSMLPSVARAASTSHGGV